MTSAPQPEHERDQRHDRQHDERDHNAPLQPHRRNSVETIAALAPSTIAWLQVPLTPARKARLDALALRGFDPIAAITDFLDDELFNISNKPSV
jgi:hypothetical protein